MSMSFLSAASGPALGYRRAGQLDPRQRVLAWSAVVIAHLALIGGLALASLKTKPAAPTPTLMVSMISDSPAEAVVASAPAPPQPKPVEPTPQPKVLAAPRPTASPMTAPPPEETVRPAPPQPAPPAPAAPAAAAVSQQPRAPGPSAPSAGAPGVTPPNFRAAYLNNSLPKYPYASRMKREEGVSLLKVYVGVNGRPEQVLLQKSSGFPALDEVAVEQVRSRWRFVPAKRDGEAVAAWVLVPLEFSIKNR